MDKTEYCDSVKNVLRQEGEKILQIVEELEPEQISAAVELILQCKGKVLLTGVGKSGLIARKIAATMTSTGTYAIYLDPTDALHGDLGIVMPSDIAVVISNSGESCEVITILPCLKERGIPVIAVVSNIKSTLAQNADVVINLMVNKEACPLNLAPSTSTTAALALGDALALTVMQAKGITPRDFALNHPSGRIGKRLTLRVRDLMHSGENNPEIFETANLYEVIKSISDGGLGAVNVIDNGRHLLGVITDGDVRRTIQNNLHNNIVEIAASNMMTKKPVTLTQDVLAYDAMHIMENRVSQISILPVVDDGNVCIGMIRLHDIVRSGL